MPYYQELLAKIAEPRVDGLADHYMLIKTLVDPDLSAEQFLNDFCNALRKQFYASQQTASHP